MPFKFEELSIPGVILVTPKVFKDDRGFFLETYTQYDFFAYKIAVDFIQDNHSRSTKNVLRGLHFQKGLHAQGKLVRCIQGEIYDVAVDIRPDSPTFKKWVGVFLNEENKKMLYIPEGFAHGFSTISDTAEITYKCTNYYNAGADGGIIWNDSDLNIDWHIEKPILSEKDQKHPTLKEYLTNVG